MNRVGAFVAVFTVFALTLGVVGMTASSGAQASSCLDLATLRSSGLVSWWPFESNSLNDVADANNPSSSSGVTFTAGHGGGQGVTFTLPPNNPGSYIDIPNSVNLSVQQFTIDAWVRPDGIGPNDDIYGSIIIVKRLSSNNNVALELSWKSNGSFRFHFGPVNVNFVESPPSFPAGAFYHVTGTYDGTAAKLYVNGTLVGTNVLPTTFTYDNGAWTIGAAFTPVRNALPRTWNGVIDDVEVFNRALTQQQIQDIIDLGKCSLGTVTPTSTPVPPTQPAPPVGGVSFDPAGRALPLETSGPSGSNSGPLAGLIGGATAGAIALVCASWYVRRRRAS